TRLGDNRLHQLRAATAAQVVPCAGVVGVAALADDDFGKRSRYALIALLVSRWATRTPPVREIVELHPQPTSPDRAALIRSITARLGGCVHQLCGCRLGRARHQGHGSLHTPLSGLQRHLHDDRPRRDSPDRKRPRRSATAVEACLAAWTNASVMRHTTSSPYLCEELPSL